MSGATVTKPLIILDSARPVLQTQHAETNSTPARSGPFVVYGFPIGVGILWSCGRGNPTWSPLCQHRRVGRVSSRDVHWSLRWDIWDVCNMTHFNAIHSVGCRFWVFFCTWVWTRGGKQSQRTRNAKITSLWRRNDVATSFWRHHDVIIASCARWGGTDNMKS